MLIASVLANILLGAVLAMVFVLYYVNGDGKWKLFLEILIGVGGNAGLIFLMDNMFELNDVIIRLYSISGCIGSFLITTIVLLYVISLIIKDKDDKDIIRLRDILLGQYTWINKYYENRSKEIDNKLNIPALEEREKNITNEEEIIKAKENYLKEELDKLEKLSNKKLRLELPEKASVVLNKEYIDAMPSYLGNVVRCISDIEMCTKMILDKSEIDLTGLKSYFISLAMYISNDIFGGNSQDVRVHFRIYDPLKKGYVKLVAVKGSELVNRDLTFIPIADDSLIKKSYECRRALIKSVNSEHDYRSNNYSVWQDYMTYTFYAIEYNKQPLLSFGISIKNVARYKKDLHFLNYFRIEDYLQNNMEKVNERIDIANTFYGGMKDDSSK